MRRCLPFLFALVASGCFDFESLSSGLDAGLPDGDGAVDANVMADLEPDLGMPADLPPPDLGPEVVRTGTVFVSQSQFEASSMTFSSTTGYANFFIGPGGTAASPCTYTSTTLPSCQIVHCPKPDLGMFDMADSTPDMAVSSVPHAGTITASGFSGTPSSFSLTPGPGGVYSLFNVNASLWVGGETLTIDAAGGDVPAFNQTLVAPSQIRVTSPVASAVTPLHQGDSLTLAWKGGTFGEAVVTFTADGSAELVSMICTASASAQTLTIPSTTVSQLPVGSTVNIGISSRSLKVSTVEGWPLNLQVTSNAVSDVDGSYYMYSTTME